MDQLGQALPCHIVAVAEPFVTVAFDVVAPPGQTAITLPNVTIPVLGSQYIRVPFQVGDKGMTGAADVALAGTTGVSGSTATLTTPPNLTALYFIPLSNTAFSAQNANVLVMYGPQGVTLADASFASKVLLTPTSITLIAGGKTVVLNSTGLTIDGIVFDTHRHTGVQTGSGDTGGPTN